MDNFCQHIENSIKSGLDFIESGIGDSEYIRFMNKLSIELYKSKREETGETNEWLENYIKGA